MANMGHKPIIGILGGIGAGKSTVAAELAALGCEVIDADAIGHELLRELDVKELLVREWGTQILGPDGQIERSSLAAEVFDKLGRPQSLARLNQIMHPRIAQNIAERIKQAQEDPAVKAVVLDAAVLVEAGWDKFCSTCIFVKAPEQSRASRASASRGWAKSEWAARENSQISLDTKAQRCEYVVDNSSGVSHLRQQVRSILDRIIDPVKRP